MPFLRTPSLCSHGVRTSTQSLIPLHLGVNDPILQGGKNLGSHGQTSSSPSGEISPNSKAHETNQWAESPKMCPSPRIPEPGGERFQKAGGVRKTRDLNGPKRGTCYKELRETQRSHRCSNVTESSDVGLSPGLPIPWLGGPLRRRNGGGSAWMG